MTIHFFPGILKRIRAKTQLKAVYLYRRQYLIQNKSANTCIPNDDDEKYVTT